MHVLVLCANNTQTFLSQLDVGIKELSCKGCRDEGLKRREGRRRTWCFVGMGASEGDVFAAQHETRSQRLSLAIYSEATLKMKGF